MDDLREEIMESEKLKKIVVVGGGTGNFSVLMGLKKYPIDLSAIVSVSDSGGHSGKLRDEFGVLPPGDIRACLVALADDDKSKLLRDLFNYRLKKGTERGVSIGNLLLVALADIFGGFGKGVKAAHTLLGLRGRVIPVSLEKTHLVAELEDGTTIYGEEAIDVPSTEFRSPIKRVWLDPEVKTNPEALAAIKSADAIVLGPGDLYTSILPNLATTGILPAIKRSKAKIIANVNIMTKRGETDGFTAADFVRVLESVLPRRVDYVVYNTKRLTPELLLKYEQGGAAPVAADTPGSGWIGRDVLSMQGGLVRHHPDKIARVVMSLIDS